MPKVIVSGHARKSGKTTIVAGMISALAEYRWSALKFSTHSHSLSSQTEDCVIYEEKSYQKCSDSSRYLAAGANRSFWIQVKENAIEAVLPRLQPILSLNPFVIIEGNSILKHIHADIHVMVLNPRIGEFKESALRLLEQPDILLLVNSPGANPPWQDIVTKAAPKSFFFEMDNLHTLPPVFLKLVRSRLSQLYPL